MSFGKWRPFCLGLNVLKIPQTNQTAQLQCANTSYYAIQIQTKHDVHVVPMNYILSTWLQGRKRELELAPCSIFKHVHDDVIKWKHFPRYWPIVRGIPRSPVNSLHKSQGRGTLMFSLIYAWINGWVNNHEACDLRRHGAHYDVIIVMCVYRTRPHSHT